MTDLGTAHVEINEVRGETVVTVRDSDGYVRHRHFRSGEAAATYAAEARERFDIDPEAPT